MRFVILHYHILKNAGSTIEEALDRSFGERFQRLDSTHLDHTITTAQLLEFAKTNPNLEAVSSHQIRYPMPETRGILFFDICFLRDPIDRVRSMYNYFRKRPAEGDPVSDLANNTEPGDFVAAMVKDFPLQIRNVQVNLIATEGDSDEPTEADLEVATARMMEATVPGVVDMFDESVAAGQHRLRTIFPRIDFAHEPVNVSEQRSACDPKVWSELIRMNELDFKLVERVREEIRRRPKDTPTPVMIDPREIFDATYYLAANPDVRAAKINPLKHYLAHGIREGRKPHPLFQPDYYQAHGSNPHRLFCEPASLEDYVRSGKMPEGEIEIDEVKVDFSIPPQQRRFFESVSRRQLEAQLK